MIITLESIPKEAKGRLVIEMSGEEIELIRNNKQARDSFHSDIDKILKV